MSTSRLTSVCVAAVAFMWAPAPNCASRGELLSPAMSSQWTLGYWSDELFVLCTSVNKHPRKQTFFVHACSHTYPQRYNYIEIKKWEHAYCQCEFSKRSISVVIRSLLSWTPRVVFVGAVDLVSTAELSLSQISLQVSGLMAKRWTISKWTGEEIFYKVSTGNMISLKTLRLKNKNLCLNH